MLKGSQEGDVYVKAILLLESIELYIANEYMLIYVKLQSRLLLCQLFYYSYSRALFTYEGNSNDIRLADKGGKCLLGY